jgi:hypothetical protein
MYWAFFVKWTRHCTTMRITILHNKMPSKLNNYREKDGTFVMDGILRSHVWKAECHTGGQRSFHWSRCDIFRLENLSVWQFLVFCNGLLMRNRGYIEFETLEKQCWSYLRNIKPATNYILQTFCT